MSHTTTPRVLLLGSRGFLGAHFRTLYPTALTPRLDITDPVAVRRALASLRPDVVINCAGKTGRPNVDWCEDHKDATLAANVTGPLVLVTECHKRNLHLVHLSSGCLYDGDNGGTGFAEDDPPNFLGSYYARTKHLAELALRDFPVLTLRLRMPFDGSLSPRNLLIKLRQYRRVLDQPNSLTHVADFLQVAGELIARRAVGVYNIVNEEAVSPYDVMLRYREVVDAEHEFEPLAQEDLGQVARTGRSNCVLSTAKLRSLGLRLPSVHEAVDFALWQLAHRLDPTRKRTLAFHARR